MDWTALGLADRIIDWLEDAQAARYAQDQRLDPFATSMRDFDDASIHLKSIRDGNLPAMTDSLQRITDLKNAGFVESDANSQTLTKLGATILSAWEYYGVDTQNKNDEMSRLMLMVLIGKDTNDQSVAPFLKYWSELRKHFDPLELIDNWDALYHLNYLDFERNGFTPGLSYREQGVSAVDIEFNLLDYARAIGASQQAIEGGERIERAYGGKIPRGRHRATFCMALEISFSKWEQVEKILHAFGYPKKPRDWEVFNDSQKEQIRNILSHHYAVIATVATDQPAQPAGTDIANTATAKNLPQIEIALFLPAKIDYSSVLVESPKPGKMQLASAGGKNSGLKSAPKKIDYEQKSRVNSAIGQIGEDFAMAYEQWRLRNHPELLKNLQHVSKENDALGYDIRSFEEDGTPRFVEVKSTLGPLETQFFLTANELDCARQKDTQYVLLRVGNLKSDPKCCEIRFPFDGKLVIEPATFSAVFAKT